MFENLSKIISSGSVTFNRPKTTINIILIYLKKNKSQMNNVVFVSLLGQRKMNL